LSKKAVALKLATNRKVRQGAVEFLKDPRADKETLALKLLSNPKMRRGPSSYLRTRISAVRCSNRQLNVSAAPRTNKGVKFSLFARWAGLRQFNRGRTVKSNSAEKIETYDRYISIF